MNNIDIQPCPCGSEKRFIKCCGRSSKVKNALVLANELFGVYNADSLVLGSTTNWDSNRLAIESLVETSLDRCENKNAVAILGAGNCKDIPLKLLTNNFNSVHLYDIDWFTLKRTVESLPQSIRQKIRYYALDVTGLWTKKDLMPEIIDLAFASDWLNGKKIITKLYKKPINFPKIEYKYDLILSINILSQLFSPFINQIFFILNNQGVFKNNEYFRTFHDAVNDYHNTVIVKQHMEFIKSISSPNGNVIISSDKYEWGVGMFAKNTNKSVSNPNDLLSPEIQMFLKPITGSTIDKYVNDYFYDIKTKQWLWNFNADRVYLVEGFLASVF